MRRLSLSSLLILSALAGCGDGDGAASPDGGTAGTGGGGTAGAGGAGATGGVGGIAMGPCGFPEREPNETRDSATPITAGMEMRGCIGSNMDKDWYELTAPNDPAGGYYEFAFVDVGMVQLNVKLYSATDNGQIGGRQFYPNSQGSNLTLFMAAAPGQKYRLEVDDFAAARPPARYTLRTTYRKLEDAHEPNDTRDTAKAITVGAPVMAYLTAGFKGGQLREQDWEDWYSVMLAPGAAMVKVENVPSNLQVQVHVFDAAMNREVGRAIGNNDGASATAMVPMTTPGGQYRIRVTVFVPPAQAIAAMMPPDNFTRPYTLTVTQ
jgi:hypothetical protein